MKAWNFIKKIKNNPMISLLVFVVMIAVFASQPYLTIIGVQGLTNAIAVMGIVIITGYTRQTHLGQSAFIGIGAYTSAVLMTRLGINFWLTIPAAIVVAAAIGVILGIPTLKLSGGPYLAMVTQIFGEIVYVIILNWQDVTGGSFGLSRIPNPQIGPVTLKSNTSLLILAAIFFLIAFFVSTRIIKSKFGRFFLSIKESEAAAQSVGINTMKYRIVAFTLAAALGGLAGVLYAQCIGFLNPEQFRWSASLTLISMAIIGGIGSLKGGAVGAIVLTVLPELLRGFNAQMRMVCYGILVIMVLMFLPDGLISLVGKKPDEIRAMFKERMKLFQKSRK